MSIKPRLGAFDISMIVVSLVIGIGIFRTPSIIAESAITTTIFFSAWIIGGAVSICGALTYAEIGSRYPVAGGFYKIFSECYHPMYAFMLNWVLVLTYGAGAAGVMIIGVEYILPVIAPAELQNSTVISLGVVGITLVLGTLNYLGIRSGARTQNLLSGIKIILILGIASLAFFPSQQIVPEVSSSSPNLFTALGVSLIAVFYTYGGYQQTMNFGGDIKDPQKNISRGIIIGMLLIILLYLLLNYAYFRILGINGIAGSDLVAAAATQRILGETGSTIISVTIFLSVLGFANATIMSNPRIYFAMAEDGILPPIFAKVNSKTQVQKFALLFFIAIILLSIFMLGTFEKIVSYVMAIDTIALATSAAAVFILRRRKIGDNIKGVFKTPLYPILPAIFIIFLTIVFINVILSDPVPALYGLGLFVLGAPLYILITKSRQRNG